jgi:subtilisin-like proprotein convertase family protein
MHHELDYRSRAVTSAVIAVILAFTIVATAAAVQPDPAPGGGKGATATGNFDIRVLDKAAMDRLLGAHAATATAQQARTARAQTMQAGLAQLRVAAPGAGATVSPVTGAVEVVKNDHGALTEPAPGRPGVDIALEFVRAHPDVYGLTPADINGLRFIGESRSRVTGIRMVRVEQRVNGLPVFGSETRFVLDREGRLIRSVGLLVPGATGGAPPAAPGIGAAEALAAAMTSVGIELDAPRMRLESLGTDVKVVPDDPRIRDGVRSELVYFPLAPGVLVLAWSQVTFTRGPADWYTLVDAKTGTLLWRKNIRAHASTQDARFSVYVQGDGVTPADSPAPQSPTPIASGGSGTQFPAISRAIVSMLAVQDATASPNGWIADGGTTTTGNNVDAYLDTDKDDLPDAGLLDDNGRPTGNPDSATRNRDFLGGAPRNFDFTPAPTGSNPDAGDGPTLSQYRRGAITNAFYVANWYHDTLYQFGFDEAAGNFQTDNFSRGGLGSDRVRVEIQDGSGTNNANFSTPPDGESGRMQMFIWSGPNPDRDGALDAEVMIHELSHGLSNRLVGNGAGLLWDPGGALGEGWSDFYALSLLNATGTDDPNGRYAFGAYVTYRLGGLTDNYLYGIRRFPYSTDMTANPLTWADVDDVTINMAGGIPPSPLNQSGNGALEVHSAGELWGLSLWEVRSLVIAGAGGDVAAGNTTMLGIVTDAMKLTPLNPSFVDARDALFAADCAANACANEASIWQGFAKRGLGYRAVAPLGHVGVFGAGAQIGIGESFAVPFLDVQEIIVNDSVANNNNVIDPGDRVFLTVRLVNPWRSAAKGVASATARLTSSTAGVTIVKDTAAYAPIPPGEAVNGTPFVVQVGASVACGQALRFTIETTSSLGTTSTSFVLRVGTASGTAAPKIYTRTIPGGLPITDNDLAGVTDTLTVPDDLEIDNLSFRIDNLTHPFTGDLAVMLRAPSGYGTDLIFQRGLLLDPSGANFVNTVIDDAAVDDLNFTTSADAPFTGSFVPAFNSFLWDLLGVESDPVGQLGRLKGSSTQGDWKLHVTDETQGDIGTLTSWSLIVTPTNFVCGAPPPPATVALGSAVLPSSRSVQVGTTATAFATIVTAGTGTASTCSIAPITGIPAFVGFQTTDRNTNALTGEPNTPVNIAANDFQTFVIFVTPFAAFGPTDLQLSFDCNNTQPAPIVLGLNTLALSASTGPVPDIVALVATLSNDGIVNIRGVNGTGVFSSATVNVGAGALITASADTGAPVATAAAANVTLPVNLFLCQTNPATGQCISAIGPTVTTQVNAGETPTFAIFVQGTGSTIPFDPANNRVFLRFKDAGNVTRGSTSVAVRTTP